MNELYFSLDIEASGPIVPEYSILSFGLAAFSSKGTLLDTFERNLNELNGAQRHPDTMKWWEKQPDAWEKCRLNPDQPELAVGDCTNWIVSLCQTQAAKPVCLVYPVWDFALFYWYLEKFSKSPFGFSCLDIKSYAMCLMQTNFRETTKSRMPKFLMPKREHTHVAVEDAIEQGELFFNLVNYNKTLVNNGSKFSTESGN